MNWQVEDSHKWSLQLPFIHPKYISTRSECNTVAPSKSFMFATKAVCLLVGVRACLRLARGEMKGLSEANRLPRLPF